MKSVREMVDVETEINMYLTFYFKILYSCKYPILSTQQLRALSNKKVLL